MINKPIEMITKNFPIGYSLSPKKEDTLSRKNILLYFNKDEKDKESGTELQKILEKEYKNSINIGPNAKLEKIKGVLLNQGINEWECDLLQIRISGHSMALDFKNLTTIPLELRFIGGKKLDEIYEIIKFILDITKGKTIKIKLMNCETGIMPTHPYYELVCNKEDQYNVKEGSKMLTELKLKLPEEQNERGDSSVEYLAGKLKSGGYKGIEISGVNGILLENMGEIDAVVSRSIYNKNISADKRVNNFNNLKAVVESKDETKLNEVPNKYDLMHVRTFKVFI